MIKAVFWEVYKKLEKEQTKLKPSKIKKITKVKAESNKT